jgi:hypothetical protein
MYTNLDIRLHFKQRIKFELIKIRICVISLVFGVKDFIVMVIFEKMSWSLQR